MNYSIEKYYDQDTKRIRYAVFCNTTHCWYFAKKYGKNAAVKLANKLNDMID